MNYDWVSFLDRIPDLEFGSDLSYKVWQEWFSGFLISTRITPFDDLPDDKKVALVLMKLKGFTPLMKALEVAVSTISYDGLVSLLNNCLHPVALHNTLFRRKHLNDESYHEFAQDLTTLSLPCRFLDARTIVRDIFINNVNNPDISKAILQKGGNPSVEDVVSMANSLVGCGGFLDLDSSSRVSPQTNSEPVGGVQSIPPNNRMTPISAGVHEVEVLFVREDSVFVCPKSVWNFRKSVLDSLQEKMKRTNENSVSPMPKNFYSALIQGMWYRVRVISVNPAKREADVDCIDFGYFKTLRYSVFCNTPLDYRVIEPLAWVVQFQKPYPLIIRAGSNVTVNLKKVNDLWRATLVSGLAPSGGALKSAQSTQSLSSSELDENGENQRPCSRKYRAPTKLRQEGGAASRGNVDEPRSREGVNTSKNHYRHSHRSQSRGRASLESNLKDDKPHSCDVEAGYMSEGRASLKGKENKNFRSGRNQRSGSDQSTCGDGGRDMKNAASGDERHPRGGYQTSGPMSATDDSRGLGRGSLTRPIEKNGRNLSDSSNQAESTGRRLDDFCRGTANGKNGGRNGYLEEPPVPLNQFCRVEVVHLTPKGEVHVINTKSRADLQKMCDDLDRRYSVPSNRTQLKTPLLRCVCALNFEGHWYRAKIIKFDDRTQKAVVKLIDFGNDETVNFKDLTFLPKELNSIPPLSFQIKLPQGQTASEGQTLEVQLKQRENDGSYAVELKKSTNGHNTAEPGFLPRPVEIQRASSDTSNFSGQYRNVAVSSSARPPIPFDQFTNVTITSKSSCGTLFGVPDVNMEALMELCAELNVTEKIAVARPQQDLLCMAHFEGVLYRCKIFKTHPSGNKVKVFFVDFGNESTVNVSELLELPKKLADPPPFAFKLKLIGESLVEQDQTVALKPLRLDDSGAWMVQVEGDEPTEDRNGRAGDVSTSSSRLLKEDVSVAVRPTNPPPIPKNSFTRVKIVYCGPEGRFAVDTSKLEILEDIHITLQNMDTESIPSPPTVGGLYVAPFEGEHFRVRVLSVVNQSCRVVFIDFGNEGDVCNDDLRILPKELTGNAHTFKISVDSKSRATLDENDVLEVTPIVLTPDGSWLVQVRGEPTPSEHVLPSTSDRHSSLGNRR